MTTNGCDPARKEKAPSNGTWFYVVLPTGRTVWAIPDPWFKFSPRGKKELCRNVRWVDMKSGHYGWYREFYPLDDA